MEISAKSCDCTVPSIKVHRCISILPNDYSVLENLPVINGVTVKGNLTSQTLSLLGSNTEEYTAGTLEELKMEGGYLVVILPRQTPKMISLDYLRSGTEVEGGFHTVDGIDTGAAIGSYQFVEKK